MNLSKIYTSARVSEIEKRTLELLRNEEQVMSDRTINSPRAVGDAIQEIIEQKLVDILPTDLIHSISAAFARRSMADCAFTDADEFYHVVDIKTHNLGTSFNMPNLTSVERLSRFYEDDKNYFSVMMISYDTANGILNPKECIFAPIEHLSWDCLTIGALGWGQIQIANSNNIIVDRDSSRKTWMLKLCDKLDEFYPKEIAKITKRISHFEKIRAYWENKE